MGLTVVTGGTGHIGATLVRALLAEGRAVRVMVRDDVRALEGLEVERASGDVRDPASLDRAFDGAEVVYHLAAKISIVGPMGGLVRATNVDGTRNVAEACRRAGVRRLVHFASVHAFQQAPSDAPLDETRPLVETADIAYDLSKADGVRAVLEEVSRGLDAVVVCPTGVLGGHDYRGSRMGLVIQKLATGKLLGLVAGGFDWVDVRDVCAGALAAEARGRAGELYLLSGGWHLLGEVAAQVEAVTGCKAPGFYSPLWLARGWAPFEILWAKLRGAEPLFTLEGLSAVAHGNRDVRWDKAAAELGYQPRPLAETVRDTVAWHQSAGLIPT